jgi:exonuclease I
MTMLEKVFKITGTELDTVKTGLLELDDFKTQGYTLQAAKALGLEGDAIFLFLAAPVEFFLKHAEDLKPYPEATGEEGAAIIAKIKEQEKSAQEGFGFVLS